MKKNGMGSHQQTIGINQEWLTPPEIVTALGSFDLDPCAPVVRPWETAKRHLTINDDGLASDWFDWERIWLNPPYDRRVIDQWMQKMGEHGNGIALIFARTDTNTFQKWVFGYASSILFMQGRITFYTVDGRKGDFNGGAPSALIAYGDNNSQAISESGIKGTHLPVNTMPVIVVGVSPTWKAVITIAINRSNGEADCKTLYDMVERIAPDKVQSNPHWKEQIRKQLQHHFNRIAKGRYTNNQS